MHILSSKPALWTGRVISSLIVLFMLWDGSLSLIKPDYVVKGSADLGYPESVLTGLGITIIVCTLLYAIPRTAVLGAVLLTGFLGGAVATHVRMGAPVFDISFAVGLGVLAWLGLYLREPRLRALLPISR